MSSNRKRKKSFLQQATKYGKKGNYGRGTNITEETFQYFLHILKVLNRDFETLDEKGKFLHICENFILYFSIYLKSAYVNVYRLI